MHTTNQLIRRIALPTLILLLSAMLVKAQGGGELDKKITFSGTHITLGKAITEIQNQTLFKFAFNPEQLSTSMPIKYTKNTLSVREALEEMFSDGKYKYVVRSRFIAVSIDSRYSQRANLVARDQDSKPLTKDIYRPNDPDSISSDLIRRAKINEDYEIERIVTFIPGDSVKRNYPESHSEYRSVEQFADLQKSLPKFAIKTNLLYTGALLTPNLSVEIGLTPKSTFELTGSYSWQGRTSQASESHKQFAHWILRPEYRFWSCERFNGHYFGVHALYSRYYVSGTTIPLLFDKKYSYDGQAAGAGFTYGYHLAIGKRWGLELNVGVGYAYMWYDKGTCSKCTPLPQRESKHYFGPTRAGINLLFLIK